jgi:hypothetical protein
MKEKIRDLKDVLDEIEQMVALDAALSSRKSFNSIFTKAANIIEELEFLMEEEEIE